MPFIPLLLQWQTERCRQSVIRLHSPTRLQHLPHRTFACPESRAAAPACGQANSVMRQAPNAGRSTWLSARHAQTSSKGRSLSTVSGLTCHWSARASALELAVREAGLERDERTLIAEQSSPALSVGWDCPASVTAAPEKARHDASLLQLPHPVRHSPSFLRHWRRAASPAGPC